MAKLFCAIVGAQGSVFPVVIDESESVGDLKEAIQKKKPGTIKCEADEIQLFLTWTESDRWLQSRSEDAKKLKKGEKTDLIEALLHEDKELQGEDGLADVLEDMDPPATGQIHVLVVIPEGSESKRSAEDERIGDVLKKLRVMEPKLEAISAFVPKMEAISAVVPKMEAISAFVPKMEAISAVVPKMEAISAVVPKTLNDFKKLSVSENEFKLDSLSTTHQSDSPIVMTPGLHEFWKGFGEFPPSYFVRMEESVFWKVTKELLFAKDRVVIIGSPGVGKSCFLMLIAFYLACIDHKEVLVIRRLKQRDLGNVVVFFDGRGSYARLTNLSPSDLFAIRAQVRGAIVLVDGFNQSDVSNLGSGYMPFDFLATSCQFDAKHDDSSRIVVLPAWRDVDLVNYAKSTNWVIETGLRKTKNLKDTTWPKLVKEQYYYSGGSLREFCKEREVLKSRVARDCRSVNKAQAFDLVYNYGGGQNQSQVDRLRRHYITDRHNEKHYHDSRWWKLCVDSGYVLSELGRIVDMDKQLEFFKYGKSVGAGFYGVAYEQLLHNAVRCAFAKRKPIVLKMREGSAYEKIEIRVPHVVCQGEGEETCYSCLTTLGKDTYWYPNYPFFPFIDAVTTCEAFPRGSKRSETIVAYIQVTIRSEKKFKKKRLRRLNKELDKNQSLKDMKRAFLVVGPDSSVCERFNLHDAPDPNTFLAMVSCFNPEQLEPKAS